MSYAVHSKGYARNAGKRWRAGDLAELRAMARSGAPVRVISLRLGRPDSAIRSKAAELGLNVTSERPRIAGTPKRTLRRAPPVPQRPSGPQLELFG